MIINTNIATTEAPRVELETTYINAFVSSIENDSATGFTVSSQIGFFETVEDTYNKAKRLKISEFTLDKQHVKFNAQVKVIEGHYVIDVYDFDVAVKEHLLKVFPSLDSDKLQITTEPIS